MSKFWSNAQSSDSEVEVENESDYEVKTTKKPSGGKFNMFGNESDSESEEEGTRVVKSQKDRTWDSLKDSVRKIKNAMKTSDWPMIQDEFEDLNKKIEKSKILIIQSGTPKFYIKALADVADHLQETLKDKEAIKKMKPAVSKAVNQMKLKVRKHNDKYKDEIALYKENPQSYESDEEEDEDESENDEDSDEDEDEEDSDDDESESDSDEESDDSDSDSDESEIKFKTKPSASKFMAGSDSEDSDFEDDVDDDEDDDVEHQTVGEFKLTGRLKWMKVEALIKLMPHLEPHLKKKKGDKNRGQIKKAPIKPVKDYRLEQDKENRKQSQSNSAWIIDKNVTEEMLDKKLREIIGSRGRKGTNVKETIRSLEVLAKAARLHGPRKEIPVLMYLIASLFDSHKAIDEYMELHDWRTGYRYMTRILNILEKNKSIALGVMDEEDITDIILSSSSQIKKGDDIKEDGTVPLKSNVITDSVNATGPIKIVGSLETFVTRLDEEYTKSLQQINPHTQEYVTRLADEASLVELSDQVFSYYCRVKDFNTAANVALLHIEHIYYKHDTIASAVLRAHYFNKTWGQYKDLHPASLGQISSSLSNNVEKIHPAAFNGNPTVNPPKDNPGLKIEELCHFIFKYGDDRSKARALLCSVHHKALHDDYYGARDTFLISHIQESVDKMDIKTQILYNRALVTLGLCAFRLGLVNKAYDCLSGICSYRLKELLAQGQGKQSYQDKDREQEKIEKRRQLPYHMHINPDLLECCHLISAMLLELPNIARAGGYISPQQYSISRQFRKYFQEYSKQLFTGPPENTREHILAAAKALLNGEWKRARDLVVNLESWNLLPGNGADKVKVLLRARIKEEGVRIYLLTYGVHFESICLSHICEMFEMDDVSARRIISRMIFDKEISAAWEHPADTLILYKVDPNAIQTMSQTLAEKVLGLMESNEMLLDPFSGMYGYKDDSGADGRDGRDRGGRGGKLDNRDQRDGGRKQWKQGNTSRQHHPRILSGRGGGRARGGTGTGKGNAWSAGRKHTFSSNNAGNNPST